jgi:2-polyprenyl-6-methoxyphenol hydroxylase-like FAD-dependent oxidoreductase
VIAGRGRAVSGISAVKATTDVMIVGGGPVGLMLAAELQRRRVDHVLIEQQPEPAYFVKALGISPRMLEIWAQVGIAQAAIDAGLFLRGIGTLVNGEVVEQTDVPAGRFPYGPLALPQFETERILREHLRRIGGDVHAGVSLRAFQAMDTGIVASVRDASGGDRTVECKYLVGCDGAHSAVRHGLGLEYEGDAYPMTFMLGDVEVAWRLPRGYAYRGTHLVGGEMRNAMAAIPIPGNPRRYRLSLAAPEAGEGQDPSKPPTLAALAEAIAPMVPAATVIAELRWGSFYRISHRIVPRYGDGRVFIAGDAAHIHPPIGGQGMNTGCQDSWNLGWKLGLVLDGRAAPGLLDSYSAERQPVGLEVVARTTRRMGDTIQGRDQESADEMLADSQLLVHYRESALVSEDISGGALAGGPRPGERAPDAGGLRRALVARPVGIHDLLRGTGHTLLFYVGKEAGPRHYEALASLADGLRARHGDAISIYAIVAPEARAVDHERFPLLVDTESAFRATYATSGPCLYLVRPDGYIGYRAAPGDPQGLQRHLSRIFAPR